MKNNKSPSKDEMIIVAIKMKEKLNYTDSL